MELQIEYIKVDELKPYEKNNKKHEDFDVNEIAKSISKYEMIDPVGIWGKDNTIVEGHGRVLACKQLGVDKVPCIRLDHLTDEQRREYAIVHNKSSELALYDFDNLADELADLDLSDFEFDFGLDKKKDKKEVEGEVEFSEELLLTHNYIVLYFDNDFDWEVAQDKFGLKKVKDLIPRKGQPTGIGRVVNGKEVLKWQN